MSSVSAADIPIASDPSRKNSKIMPAMDRKDSDENIVDQIDDLTMLGIEELAEWLSEELGERFDVFRDSFVTHKIDGRCFHVISEKHLTKMAPSSTIGDRLSVLTVRDKVIRASRMARRNQVVTQGDAHIEPPGSKGKYILTNGALKLIFTHKQEIQVGDGKSKTVNSSFVDHIDLNTIGDVDIEETVDVEEIYDTYEEKTGGCFPKKETKTFLKESHEVQVAKIYIALNKPCFTRDTGEDGGTTSITLTPASVDEAKELHVSLIDAMEEVQQVQIVHYE